MKFIEWLQRRLAAHGCDPGAIDGVYGRRTIAALEAFQAQQGLTVSGTADAATIADLRVDVGGKATPEAIAAAGATVMPRDPVWLTEARRYMGLHEIEGRRSNSTIIGFAKALGGWIARFYNDDDIPWCGLFVAHVISAVLPKEPLPNNPLGAINWRSFGNRLTTPGNGAILVFHRIGGGHVGFHVGEDDGAYHVLGGNQSNSVSIARVAKARLVAIRWPATAGAASGGRVAASPAGTLSENEA